MEVRSCMTKDPITVRPTDSVARVWEILESQRIDQVPVVVEGRVMGIVADRDIRDAFPPAARVRGGRALVPDPSKMPVELIMTQQVLTVEPTDDLVYAALLMRRERIGSLLVVEGNRLVGILTRADVLSAWIHQACGEEHAHEARRPQAAGSSAYP